MGAAYFIERQGDRTLLGGVTLTNIRRGVTQSASVGYWIGLPYIRQGYTSDALAAMLRHAFEDLELNRVEAACMPSNRASLAVLERACFRQEGLARRYLKINGVFEDHILLARLRDDAPVAARAREMPTEAPATRVSATVHRTNGGQLSDGPAQTSIASAAEGHAA
jgi:ribosomal-protein-alanine N-acetyltransferase